MRRSVSGAALLLLFVGIFSPVVFADPSHAESSAEPSAEMKIYNNPSLAEHFMYAHSYDELQRATESFLELARFQESLNGETFFPVGGSFLDALERLDERMIRAGFGGLLSEDALRARIGERFEHSKQAFLEFLSGGALQSYFSGLEVFYASELLTRLVDSGHLSREVEIFMVSYIAHVCKANGIEANSFLKERVLEPILSRNQSLVGQLEGLSGSVTIVKKEGLPISKEMTQEELLKQELDFLKAVNSPIDLIETREGLVEGRPEEIRKIRRAMRRGRR